MNAQRERQISTMLLLGLAGFFGGGMVFLLGIMLRMMLLMALGPIMIVAGVGLAGYAVFSGHVVNQKAAKGGTRMVTQCYVVARFAINELGEMIFDNFDFDAPNARYYVRLKMPDGRDEEFQCARELLYEIGEGMVGNVQIEGRWLGSFVPIPRAR